MNGFAFGFKRDFGMNGFAFGFKVNLDCSLSTSTSVSASISSFSPKFSDPLISIHPLYQPLLTLIREKMKIQ